MTEPIVKKDEDKKEQAPVVDGDTKKEAKTYEDDNRVMTLVKKTSKKGNTYYSIMKHNDDGSVGWMNSYFGTVSKAGNIAIRKSDEELTV